MSVRPEQVTLVRQWILKAEEDLLNAKHTLTLGDDCPLSTVCFHAQQCAEKYLKALLSFRSVEFPKTHDLVLLLNRVKPVTGLNLHAKDVQSLNRYSIEFRYPGDVEPIDRQDALRSVERAQLVREEVRNLMPGDILQED